MHQVDLVPLLWYYHHMSLTHAGEVRFTQPGPDSGNKVSLDEQGEWIRFAESAENVKGRGELRDSDRLAELALQHAEDQVDITAGITPLQVK